MATATTRTLGRSLAHLASVWGLLLLLVLLLIAFSVLRPNSFPTLFTLQSLLNSRSINGLAALAVMIPLVTRNFDLSVASVIGLSQVMTIGLQANYGFAWEAAVLSVLLIGALVGLVNGFLVTRMGIDSFIATLGVGSVLYGANQWFTGGRQIVGTMDRAFFAATGKLPWIGVPLPFVYLMLFAVVLWIVLEYLPLGRYLYALGDSARAAHLNGISARLYVPLAFVVSGLLAAFAGMVLQSQLRVGQSTVGPEYMLPAFTGALLGATTIRPGRANVWGTLLAVAVLAVAVTGLGQLGAPFFIEPLFNGAMLVVAVGLAVAAERRRDRPNAAPAISAGPRPVKPVSISPPLSERPS